MAFICTFDPESISAHVIIEPGRALANIPIGVDHELDRSYSLFVALGPQAGGDFELTFCVIDYDGTTDTATDIWDSLTISRLIESADRKKILLGLLEAVRRLVETVKPPKVFLCTLGPSVEGGVERKYVLIARTFEMCGYEVRCADEYHGQRAWWMERK